MESKQDCSTLPAGVCLYCQALSSAQQVTAPTTTLGQLAAAWQVSLREHSLNLEGQSAMIKAAAQNFWDGISSQFGHKCQEETEEPQRAKRYLPMLQTHLQQGVAFSEDNTQL